MQQAGGPGGHVPPHFLADQLTLSLPGGAHYPHQVVRATPDFQTLRRPWNMSQLSDLGIFSARLVERLVLVNLQLLAWLVEYVRIVRLMCEVKRNFLLAI